MSNFSRSVMRMKIVKTKSYFYPLSWCLNSSNVPTYFCARYFASLSLVIATTTLSQYLHHNAPKLNIYGHKYRTSASIGDTVVCKLVMNIGKIDNFEIGSRALSRPLSRIDLSSSTAGFALKRDNWWLSRFYRDTRLVTIWFLMELINLVLEYPAESGII